jgi:hypothetical protein
LFAGIALFAPAVESLSLGEPSKQLGIQIRRQVDRNMVSESPGPQALDPEQARGVDLMIRKEPNAKVACERDRQAPSK